MEQEFMALFAGLPRAYGVYVLSGEASAKGKRAGQATTLQKPVTPELWAQHLRGEIQLGIVPIRDDGTCTFGVIDIDDYKLDHAALAKAIAKKKLPLIQVRSKSGGGHLYVFWNKPTPAQDTREALSHWSAQLGYAGVEVFPKQNRLLNETDTGNWINMPYCGGTDRCALLNGVTPMSAEEFLEYAHAHRADLKKVAPDDEVADLEDGPPCLMMLCSNGVPEGTRNNVMFNLGVYARKRWQDDWQAHVPELNERFINPPLPEGEITQIIHNLSKKAYAYTCKNSPLQEVCQKQRCMKRKFGIGPDDAEAFFGFDIRHVVRLETSDPVYFADVNGKRVTFNADDINSQLTFRRSIIAQVNESFTLMNSAKWSQFIMRTLAAAEIVEPPPETKRDADLVAWLENYCTENVTATDDWQEIVDGLVKVEDDRMVFRPHKWLEHINTHQHVKLKIDDVYRGLLGIGVQSVKRILQGRSYVLWSVPAFAQGARDRNEEGGL